MDNWSLQSLLTGIKRLSSLAFCWIIYTQLNLRTSLDASFRAASSVSVFGLLRKSLLLINSPSPFDAFNHLLRSDFYFHPRGALVAIRWSKLRQFREQGVHLPLPADPDSPLYPVTSANRQTDGQTDNLYLSTMITKATQVIGSLHFTVQSSPTS